MDSFNSYENNNIFLKCFYVHDTEVGYKENIIVFYQI